MAKKETEEKPGLPRLRFRADQKSPTLEIGNGEYRRVFNAKDQPFEVESDDEFQLLKGSGYFVVVPESKDEPAAAATGTTNPTGEQEKPAKDTKEPAGKIKS